MILGHHHQYQLHGSYLYFGFRIKKLSSTNSGFNYWSIFVIDQIWTKKLKLYKSGTDFAFFADKNGPLIHGQPDVYQTNNGFPNLIQINSSGTEL